MKNSLLFISLILILTSCLKEEELKGPFVSYNPKQINDGWQISDPTAEKIDPDALADIYKDFHADESIWQVRSLLVFRNGRLVAESYTKDDNDITALRAIWSATKQVVGLLTGIALEKQIIKSINDPVSDYLAETNEFEDKKDIRIEDLLTMRSGISYSNDGLEGQTDDILRQLPDKITAFILGRNLEAAPGEKVRYKDCDPQLVSSVIQASCGKSTRQWASEVLFEKLEIKNLEWDNYKDGITLGGFGILTTPRELAKFGQCVLDSGMWKGTQVVTKDWIKEMTTVRIQDIYGYQFGYLWWKDESRGMTFMSGHGGQYVCIIPSKNLIVVMASEVNTQGEFQFGKEAFDWVDRIVKIAD
jgi:CubicO group peptidase (beta-lactamase class C family)